MILKRLIPLAPVLAALAIVLSLSVSDTAYGSFSPVLDVTITDPTAEVASDQVLEFSLPDGDVNFAALVGFIPPEWGVVDGHDIPIGAEVGLLRADTRLGIIGSPCNQVFVVEFKMFNASLDQTDSFEFDDDNFGGPVDEDGNETSNDVDDWAEDINENGLIGAIEQWPEFIFRVLDETTEAPIRRSAGLAIVASTPILLQFLVFPPGTFIDEDVPNDEALGYPSITFLQNIGDPELVPQPGPITDFCSPLSTVNTSFGITKDNPDTPLVIDETEDTPVIDESGYPLFINPQDGDYIFTIQSAGQRDADGDGYENSLDTCALDVNVGSPRIPNDGDLDFDGLDAACDPDDNSINTDHDGDGYLNRQDNCPLLANGEDLTNQADADSDGIGDVCDPDVDDADAQGEVIISEATVPITIGAGGDGGPPDCSTVSRPDGTAAACWPDLAQPIETSEPTDGPDETDSPDGNGSTNGEDDGGSDTGLIIGIIVGIVAAVVIVGGGAALMMRRNDSA